MTIDDPDLVPLLKNTILRLLREAGIRVPRAKAGPLAIALEERIIGVLRHARRSPADPVTGGDLVAPWQDHTQRALTPRAAPPDAPRSKFGTALSHVPRADFTDHVAAAFDRGELVALPVTINRPGHLGETEQRLVPVAPADLRAGIEAARRRNESLAGRFAARLGDMPERPERQMLPAHLESGYLDVWFEDYTRWRRDMLEEFVAPTGRGGRG